MSIATNCNCFGKEVGKLFRHTDVSKQLQKMCREADRTEEICVDTGC